MPQALENIAVVIITVVSMLLKTSSGTTKMLFYNQTLTSASLMVSSR